MLPDFRIPLEGRVVVARDVPVCVFFHGSDGGNFTMPWLRALVRQIVVRPALTEQAVRSLGDAVAEPAFAYMKAVGFLTQGNLADLTEEAKWRLGRALTWTPGADGRHRSRRPASELAALLTPEGPALVRLIGQIAQATRVPPHVVWRQWTISEYAFTSSAIIAAKVEVD